MASQLYVGLMSGTSMDGVDVAVVEFTHVQPNVLGFATFDYPSELRQRLNTLCVQSANEVVTLGQTDREVAKYFAQAVLTMLAKLNISKTQVVAIGSHGQTVRHHPDGQHGFTLQIGDPNTLAIETGIDVIADFRRKDIALGGQGAPLAPAFHQAIFRHSQHSRAIVNIGGIANVTYLSADSHKPVLGWDTGPGNTLMDAWCQLHNGKSYDANGQWAASATHNRELLKVMFEDDYFALQAPKSTGRERFNMAWLQQCLERTSNNVPANSVQTTLAMLTACTISSQVKQLGDVEQVYICGGGAKNDFLMECLSNELVEQTLDSTIVVGMDPDAVEAVAFAWLAYAHRENIPGNLPSVTGASKAAVLGGMYPAS